MAAVANHQQPLPPSNARNSPNSMDYPDTPPPPTAAPAKNTAKPAAGKPAAKKGSAAPASTDPNDAHKALLSKISQLEATRTTESSEQTEIDAEVRKANRDLSHLLQTLEPHNSKLDILQRKYTELLGEMKRVEREHMKAKKRGDQLQKEKEELGKERTRERGLKEKLEKLSRELTRENKRVKEEVRDVRERGEERSEELHRKLETLVLDVEEVVAPQNSHHPPHASSSYSNGGGSAREQEREQDALFRTRFTSFLHQYEMRELHFQSLLRLKDLEIAYHAARHDALKKAQESELRKGDALTRQVSTFSQTENELRGQLNVYVEKFKQVRSLIQNEFRAWLAANPGRSPDEFDQRVEDTLNNSNDLFLTFRKEMEEMSKKTKRLEKENLNLTRKQEATNKNIFQMAEERSQSQQVVDRLGRENEKLRGLCRAMQSGGYGGAGQPGLDALDGPDGQVEGGAQREFIDGEGTESEYEEEEYDEDEEDPDGEGPYDDDTEEEEGMAEMLAQQPVARAFGPPPPPPPPQDVMVNGKGKAPMHQQQQQQRAMPNGTAVNGRH
ncbi:hypothetical protein LTR97_010177 [Elasticomyces elasticus]|uniref:Alpha-taxilin n=1 Tax=Elasticomyces elasticus TaxID=574655 RepID=A0AAN8A0Y0_9PEZI|nr:hypothetical protein LTR97_010177 [Elasticomyces elasticus]